MKKPIIYDFPPEEFEARLKKLVSLMNRDNIDVIIFNSKENNNYFTGLQSAVWASNVSTPGALVVTRNGDAVMVSNVTNRPTAEATAYVEEVLFYDLNKSINTGEKTDTFGKIIYDVIKKKGFANGRIGLETGLGLKMHFNYNDLMDLLNQLSSCEIVEVGDIIWECRMIKSQNEIEYMRRASDITARAFNEALSEVHYGMTEMELNRKVEIKMLEMGATDLYQLALRAGKERYTQGNSPACDRPIKTGDVILIDGGCIYKGYYCDIIRQGIIGQPTAIQREMFDIAAGATELGLSMVKPGVLISEVAKAVAAHIDKSRFAHLNATKTGCGHSLGLNVHEYPMLGTGNDIELRPGMVFAIEPYILDGENGSMGIEENFLVTENGCEVMSHTSHDLIII